MVETLVDRSENVEGGAGNTRLLLMVVSNGGRNRVTSYS